MVNTVVLQGRLTKDPERLNMESGKSGCRFTIAQTKWNKESQFINCAAWGTTAENILQYFQKGKEIVVVGSIDVTTKTLDDGTKRTYTTISVSQYNFCGSKKDSNADAYRYDTSSLFDNTGDTGNFGGTGGNGYSNYSKPRNGENVRNESYEQPPFEEYSDDGYDEDLPF